jgi:hypothetical protein
MTKTSTNSIPARDDLWETRQLRLLTPELAGSEIREHNNGLGLQLGVTFQESRQQGVHRWYPYVEGFSASYLRDVLVQQGDCANVYDPFGGAGTTQLTASWLGLPSFYSEINPFMAFVAETKVRAASWAGRNPELFASVASAFSDQLTDEALDRRGSNISLAAYDAAFPGRDFFEERPLRHLLAARDLAIELASALPEIRSLLLLACAANAVRSSNMTRRADLRRRRSDEYKKRVVDVPGFIRESVTKMISDIQWLPEETAEARKVSDDCRQLGEAFFEAFDLAITSPPYLNGTNYFRNTKIELWLLGFIASEADLTDYRARAIAAGINNVSKSRGRYQAFADVERVASDLDIHAKDKRIPLLIRHYFSDMHEVLIAVHRSLRPGRRFILDIGDSKFYGVHVPTDELLVAVGQRAGFELEDSRVLARRLSHDKTPLTQVELTFRKACAQPGQIVAFGRRDTPSSSDPLTEKVKNFAESLPYTRPPYNSRAWGHRLHSLCSYQGKLKPALAHWVVREMVDEGATVLDPLGGVGTVPFEAALSGRPSVSNDKSPFASLVAAAKLDPPSLPEAEAALARFAARLRETQLDKADFEAAEFGLNARVADYYHPATLENILRARKVLASDGRGDRGTTFVWASLLHILHGNRPYALSRTSHPITPFNPSGAVVQKDVIEHIRRRMVRALSEPLPRGFVRGSAHNLDFRDLPGLYPRAIDAIVTSPPFLGMRFDRPNWLRLWFCGWLQSDFHKTSLTFLERQQVKSRSCYTDFFGACRELLKPGGLLVLHLGSGGGGDLLADLRTLAGEDFEFVGEVAEDVAGLEQHGIRDKGRTRAHHLLFFRA